MSIWKIKCNEGAVDEFTDFDDLGLSQLRRSQVNQGVDTVTFRHAGSATASLLFPTRSTVTITRDDVQWFLGRVGNPRRIGAPTDEAVEYEILGPWFWLEKIPYLQNWLVYNTGLGALQTLKKTRVILGQDDDGTVLTTGEQIEAALQCAIDAGAPLQIGYIASNAEVPWEQTVDITVAEVIVRMLRHTPDCLSLIDYTTTPPTFHVSSFALSYEKQLAVGTAPLSSVASVTPRYDLQVPGVRIRYERRAMSTGLPGGDNVYHTVVTEDAGDMADLEAVTMTIELAGWKGAYQSEYIETETIPLYTDPPATDGLNDKTWWKYHRQELALLDVADFTITDAARSGDFPAARQRVLLSGTLQDWMTEDGDPLLIAHETVSGLLTITRRAADGTIVAVEKAKKVSFPIVSTNAQTKWYVKLMSEELGEPKPTGLAATLLASWGILQYDAEIVLVAEDCEDLYWPGQRINILNGDSAWSAMNARVQSVREDVDSGTTVIRCGAAKHLGPDSLMTLFRQYRARRPPTEHRSRITGLPSDDQDAVVRNDENAPYKPDSAVIDGEYSELTVSVRDSEDEPTAAIELKPDPSTYTEHKVLAVQMVDAVPVMKIGWVRAHS